MQSLQLQDIIPTYLEEEKIKSSSVWGNDILLTRGKNLAIVAPSGSGKTSLIHFLYGLRADYTGNIFYDDINAKSLSADEKAKERAAHISIIFQDLRLFPRHTVYENINVKKQLSPCKGAAPIKEMAARLGIENKLSQSAGTCSYGEQQRIAIIRSLQQPFDFILLDEPFSHLDEDNSIKAMELIQEEAMKRKASIILADLHPVEFFIADALLHL